MPSLRDGDGIFAKMTDKRESAYLKDRIRYSVEKRVTEMSEWAFMEVTKIFIELTSMGVFEHSPYMAE